MSVNTIIQRAKSSGCYLPHPRKKVHDRQVVTLAIGALVQHDASTHLWSPFASQKWTLITSLDDYSRKMLYAEFVEQETCWAHIQAAQDVTKEWQSSCFVSVGKWKSNHFALYQLKTAAINNGEMFTGWFNSPKASIFMIKSRRWIS